MGKTTAVWIEFVGNLDNEYACSKCGHKPLHNETGGLEFSKFCPNCGAEMVEVEGWLKGRKKK